MQRFLINGGNTLTGEIRVSGAKNFALKALAASVMLDGEVTLSNVPKIEDIHRKVELMKDLGVEVTIDDSTYKLKGDAIKKWQLNPGLHQKIRTSVLLAGPILHRFGKVDFPYPGGCVIGKRPINYFLEGFKAFGVEVVDRDDGYSLVAKNLRPAKIVFPRISHTTTEAMMTFATKVPGTTTLVNAAMEPEVVASAEFLNKAGAKISGAGTSVITIEGVTELRGLPFTIIPDRIEAGTFAILAAASKSHLKVTNINPAHLEVLWQLLKRAGVKFELGETHVEVFQSDELVAIPHDLVTHEYPGFVTDLQAPMAVLMTQAKGNSLIFETIFEGRLFYIDTLNSMGADILMCDPHRVLITGPTQLVGQRLASPDIRAGIALVIAGLIAKGQTEIDNIYQIDRGYENIEGRLQAVGADIKRID